MSLVHADAAPAEDVVSGRLTHLGLLRFAGVEAHSFLQGQVSQDVKRLAEGPLLAAYSSPQGRVVALLHLVPHSTGIIAILPADIVLPTLERLRKFVLRAKVTIEDISDQFAVLGLHDVDAFESPADARTGGGALSPRVAAPPSAAAAPAYREADGVGIARIAGTARHWVVGDIASLAQRGFVPSPDQGLADRAEHAWRLADIRDGRPQVYAATREMFVAQMLNLDLLDGISFSKGCYTGQEIIARTQHLGRIKRRLSRLRLPSGSWALGQAIQLSDGRSGRLTELAATAAGCEALAVLTLSRTPEESGAEARPPKEPAAPRPVPADSASSETRAGAADPSPIDAIEVPLPYAV